jgi:DNA adenine methylase
MDTALRNQKARPVLKWVGGKGQLLPELVKRVPADFGSYHEPFVGGGALFFELAAHGKITTAYLSDINPSLIDVYMALRDCVDEVIKILKRHRHDEDYYYKIRALQPEKLSLSERAARVIYLNKTCYNGLYRENRAGEFNVPFGRYKNPTICDEPNLRSVSCLLQSVSIERRHFSSILEVAQPDDFVYFDPPYHPASSTANFTAYDRNGFGEQDQIQLRDIFSELTQKGVRAMLSNSDTPFIRRLYANFLVSRVYATRAVNSKADSRGKVAEVIVCNFDEMEMTQRALLNKRFAYRRKPQMKERVLAY